MAPIPTIEATYPRDLGFDGSLGMGLGSPLPAHIFRYRAALKTEH